ncbi:hypothetical protein O7634_24610 [Micromonospora sp. WMMD1120]|uniref:hypothetical protein n=1 Tax=Micromonospora sp. WMMD1120 TaxID=3016106 RepID=UPI0024178B7C|nr:hypothetical protein [Micromonospora sp. WMMD1120]MDG4809946.1 hypothetical protein [Micromonospora sp. WMMD1120]
MGIQTGNYLTPQRLNTRSVRARRTNTLSLSSGAVTAISFDAEDFDNSSMFAATSTIITLPIGGLWGFAAGGVFASNGTGLRRLLVDVNGSGTYPWIDSRSAVSGDNTAITLSDTHVAAAGDQLQLFAHQNSGGALNLLAGVRFSAWLIEF